MLDNCTTSRCWPTGTSSAREDSTKMTPRICIIATAMPPILHDSPSPTFLIPWNTTCRVSRINPVTIDAVVSFNSP
ncbi:hypothetical protein VTK26DRAFT_8488 [Humicola hyalothermophila]